MTTGKIGTADLTANVDTLLGAAMTEPTVANIQLTNRTGLTVSGWIAIGTGGAPAATDWLEYNTPFLHVLGQTGIVLSTGEKIWVKTDTAGVTARAHGIKA